MSENYLDIIKKYYNDKIQIDINVIIDVFKNIYSNENSKKILVFGLGYDSKMWYYGNNKNTYFVENKDEYIELNKNDIDSDHIIKYNYKITCESSTKLKDNEIEKFIIPDKLLNLGPFDIIIIDGPEGYNKDKPGRLIPCYWSTLLSKKGTLIYIDDSRRKLENYCILKFFSNKIKEIFKERDGCTKIFF